MAKKPTITGYYSLKVAGDALYRALDAVLSDVPDETKITIETHHMVFHAKNSWNTMDRERADHFEQEAAPTEGDET